MASSGIQWHPVASSGLQWPPVASNGLNCLHWAENEYFCQMHVRLFGTLEYQLHYAAQIRFQLTSTIVLSFPFFCSNKGFIGTFIGFRPYLRDLLRMQKSIQSLDMTNCGDEEPLKVFLSNLPIFSC